MPQAAAFRLRCDDCGHEYPFMSANAGEMIPCVCGKQLKIPKLSELRRLAGQPTEFINIADELRKLYLDKQLPPDPQCMFCQVKTANTLQCWVECERAQLPSEGIGTTAGKTLILNAVLPFFGLFYFPLGSGQNADAEAVGNDVVVRTPLSVCENCLPKTSRKPDHIRGFLRSVPLYRQLLDTYPGARVGTG